MNRMRWLAVMASMILAGCAGLGPTPAGTAPPEAAFEWTEALRGALPQIETPVQPLRDRITDPQLAALVDKALADNLDVQAARERITEARALSGVDLSRYRPQLGVNVSATEQRLSENGLLPAGRIPGFETDQTIYEAGFDASWELGLFGRRATVAELGALRVAAPEIELAGVEESLVAEIVRQYIEHRRAAGEQALLGTIVDRQQALLEATKRRRDHGEASDFDVALASAQLMAARARLPGAARAQRVAAYRLATLTGQSPAALSMTSDDTAPASWTPGAGLETTTSDVLRRRPDVRLAEVRYAQSVRDLDLARLEFYPSVTLFASVGPESTSLSTFTDSASLASSVGGLIDWALFDGKRRRLQRDAATSRQAQAALAYRDALLGALEDVETSAAKLAAAEAQLAQQRAVADARERIAEMARARFEGGTVSLMTVLEAERDWADAQITVRQLEATRQTEALALEKALGAI